MTDSTMTLPEFEVGQVWRTRKGGICRVLFISQDQAHKWPIQTDLYDTHWHKLNGNSCLGNGNHEDDLIYLIKPSLAVGQTWEMANGEKVTIEKREIANGEKVTIEGKPIGTGGDSFFRAGGFLYTDDGMAVSVYAHDGKIKLIHGERPDLELISLIKETMPEPIPTPSTTSDSATTFLPPLIASGDVPFYVVVAIDSEDGEKLVWETPMPEGATLEAALKQRLQLNPRYSVSYIAECRIIPLLTQQS